MENYLLECVLIIEVNIIDFFRIILERFFDYFMCNFFYFDDVEVFCLFFVFKLVGNVGIDVWFEDWINFGIKWLWLKGYIIFIYCMERLDDILFFLWNCVGDICLYLFWFCWGESVKWVLIIGIKGVLVLFWLFFGIFLYEEGWWYSCEVEVILRVGNFFNFD